MSYQQTPTRLITDSSGLPPSPALPLDEIQGDVLIGLQKNVERFVFFQIADVLKFKDDLRWTIADQITTTQTVRDREFCLSEMKAHDDATILPLIGLNLSFTNNGIQKLVPGADLGDASFIAGAKAQAPTLGDPVDPANNPTTWVPAFLAGYDAIDGVFLITGGTHDDVDTAAQSLLSELGADITVIYQETANVRPGLERGHEHFGWLDGVSQPGVKGLTDPFPGQRLLDAGHFVFGYPGQDSLAKAIPPVAITQPPPPVTAPSWMVNGSFLVFRRLKQLVPEFEQFLLDQELSSGGGLGTDPVLLGARMVGRWKSGAPMALTPSQDDPSLGSDPQGNNNFDFADDQAERRCPFGAHIRKVNPRADFPNQSASVDPRRVIRAGIPYGPEVDSDEETAHASTLDRGLMFLCYQTSIIGQFEFLQNSWANNPQFISPIIPKTHGDGSPVTVGFDPLIGQNALAGRARTMDEPISNYPTGDVRSTLNEPQDFIVPTAAAYFFVPSISAMKTVLST